jgi:hypothetical protein
MHAIGPPRAGTAVPTKNLEPVPAVGGKELSELAGWDRPHFVV